MKWTQDYPKVAGWYWVMHHYNGEKTLEEFFIGSDGLLCTADTQHNEYGQDSYEGYMFSSSAIQEPEFE